MSIRPTDVQQDVVTRSFVDCLPISNVVEPRLASALRHVLSHPGSLVRARLAYQLGIAFRLPHATAEALAAGLEYMHTASLLFDDMPAMDDAQERRAHTCTHLLFGEAASTLTALTLINRGYALFWKGMSQAASDRQIEAARRIEQCLGLDGMLSGQSLDLHHTQTWTAAKIFRVSMGKTVALIRLTLVLPALLGDAGPRAIQRLQRLGTYWGLSYQILDDLKDVCLQKDSTGKTTRRDAQLGRPNLALAEGIQKSLERVTRLLVLSEATIRDLTQDTPQLSFLTHTQRQLQSERRRFDLSSLSVCA